jgi:hypothetical protein
MHIIFGCKNPSQRAPRLRKKGDLFYSASNYNLIIDDDRLSELTLGEFLRVLDFGTIWEPMELDGVFEEPAKILEDDLRPCSACQKSTKVACALFQNPAVKARPDTTLPDFVKATTWRKGADGRLDLCRLVQPLLDMTETPAERRFYELYLHYSLSLYNAQPHDLLRSAYSGDLFAHTRGWEHPFEVGDDSWMFHLHERLLALPTAPAFIPQVVLNFVDAESLPEGHPDKEFYDSNVGRADFMFFDNSGKHIVEIDGPYHHRNDEDYTRLLRQDRTLRRQRYHVHRFSNLEVVQAKDFYAFAWELF